MSTNTSSTHANMADSLGCIPANPDISGIGVRTATYAQNLLSFGPAIYALLDRKVTSVELDSMEDQSTTILITAFAILLSAIIQTLTLGLSNFHATIVLNLSWMNNTNTFIYLLLYFHHIIGPADREDPSSKRVERTPWNTQVAIRQGKKILQDPVVVIGSLHLSLMAAVGIWLWTRPSVFGNSPPCAMSASVVILGQKVKLTSKGLRIWSILAYSLFVIPGVNLILPVCFFLGSYLIYKHCFPAQSESSIKPIVIGLIILAFINLIFLIDTEIAIHKNATLQQDGDSLWTFGQTLALLLLLIPLRDLVNAFRQRQKKKLDEVRQRHKNIDSMRDAIRDKDFTAMKDLIQLGVEVKAKGTPLT